MKRARSTEGDPETKKECRTELSLPKRTASLHLTMCIMQKFSSNRLFYHIRSEYAKAKLQVRLLNLIYNFSHLKSFFC